MNITIANVRVHKNIKSLKEIRNQNVITQSLDYSCGPAGLATILNYYLGDPVNEKEIISTLLKSADIAKVAKRKGFSLFDLKKFAQDRGYKVTGYKMDMDFLRKLGEPVLVPIKFKNYKHFIVVKGVIADRVFIADPTLGNSTMKICNFESIWQDGIGLVIESKNNGPKDSFNGSLSSRLEITGKDAAMADYKTIKRITERSAIRISVYPTEF